MSEPTTLEAYSDENIGIIKIGENGQEINDQLMLFHYREFAKKIAKATIAAVMPPKLMGASDLTYGYDEAVDDMEQRAARWLGEK